MATLLPYIALGLLLLAVAGGWLLTLVGMPGNWLMVLAAAGYAGWGAHSGATQLSWTTVAALTALAVVGELTEFAAGIVGARRAGGSRRAAVFSLLGSFAGALIGATLGVPIPVLGSALGAVLGGAVGAFVGAAFAEHSLGELPRQSFNVGQAAFWGRLLGTGAKTVISSVMAIITFIALAT